MEFLEFYFYNCLGWSYDSVIHKSVNWWVTPQLNSNQSNLIFSNSVRNKIRLQEAST